MGRTIRIKAIFPNKFTKEDISKMLQIKEKYNSNEFENIWTCENYKLFPKIYSKDYSNFNDEMTEISEYIKIKGNEFNAFIIIQALKELSLLLPHVSFNIVDEGRYLFFPVILQNGMVKINITKVKDDHEYWLDYKLHEYIDEFERKKKTFEFELLDELYPNIDASKFFEGLEWIDIDDVCRKIEPHDFVDYQDSEGTIMGGFEGEYWNKEVDAEKASYEMNALIFKIFSGFGKVEM